MATRWGIVGAGLISHDFTSALCSLKPEEHKVEAVAARNLERAKEFASKFAISKAYDSYEQLAKDPNIDVVYVGAIHPAHHSICKLLIEANKNVLCEKPLTINKRQTQELIDLAKEHNVFLMEAFWSRFFPMTNRIKTIIANEEFGELRQVSVHFGFDKLSDASISGRYTDLTKGGGTILDMGCYGVQFALMVFSEMPKKIVAAGIITKEGVDQMVNSTFFFSNNRTAQLIHNMDVTLCNEAVLHFTKGIVKVSNFWNPSEIETPNGKEEIPLPVPTRKSNFPRSEGLVYEAESVRDCIKKGLKEHPAMTWQDSLNIATTIDEIRRQIGVIYPEDSQ